MNRLEATAALARTQQMLSDTLWAVGELAYALGREPHGFSDEDTARCLSLPSPLVSEAKRMFVQFQTIASNPQFRLLYAHYQCVVGRTAPEAAEALAWARANQANPSELRAYLRLQYDNGREHDDGI